MRDTVIQLEMSLLLHLALVVTNAVQAENDLAGFRLAALADQKLFQSRLLQIYKPKML